jgi:hypothetical protein
MQKLSITKRPAQLKGSISSRPEIHGDATVPALTVSVHGILLFSKDLITMYNDEDAHNRLFKKSDAGLVPAFPGTILVLTEIFKGAKVTLKTVNMEQPLILKPATVKDIWLEVQDAGGHVLMNCKILGAPADDAQVNPLHMVNQKCTIAILNGALAGKEVAENQGELPLDEGAPPNDDDPDATETEAEQEEADATESAISRQIRSSEAKKKRAGKNK